LIGEKIYLHTIDQGFKKVYDQSYSYSHATTSDELNNIKSQCNPNSIICVGGANNINTLLLVSCGSCLYILTTTILHQPILVNGAWWYFTPGYSFGFAPNSNINQYYADVFDCDSSHINCKESNRLSWHLMGADGGYRLGIIFIYQIYSL
jgi:hypothetical protein